MPPPRMRLVRFGVFEFDPVSGDLWRAGRRIRLQNQPRQVLKILVARHGELVGREEFRRQLWPGDTFVDFDNGLNVAVRKIREAVGDVAPSPRFIETERALGYRFIAPVSETVVPPDIAEPSTETSDVPGMPSASSAPAALSTETSARGSGVAVGGRRRVPRPSVVLAAIAASVLAASSVWVRDARDRTPPARADAELPAPASLAVLPLTSGPNQTDTLLAVGIADGIITRLSNVKQFRVRPTSAVTRYHGTSIDTQEVGRDLRSQYVLVGTLRTTVARVRVSVQLVNATDGSTVWGDQYDVARGELLSVEDTIAEEIATTLQFRLSDAERDRLYRRYTRSGAAYERYLMGRARLRAVTGAGAREAIAEFEAARQLDREFALAHAGIATAAAQLRVRFASGADAQAWDARARLEAGRALQLDPDLAEAHVALAAVHRFQEFDWPTVISESRRAIDLNPSLDVPHLYLAAAYFHVGLLDEAEAAVYAARQLNPENRIEPLEILGAISLFAARPLDAVRYLSEANDISDSQIVSYMLAWALYYTGERERSTALLEALARGNGPVTGNARATLAAFLAARGDTAEARTLAERVASEQDLLHHAAYGLATAYAQLGEPAEAVRWLSRAVATGFSCYPWYGRDPLLDPIRSDARFELFMQQLRQSWEDVRARYTAGS